MGGQIPHLHEEHVAADGHPTGEHLAPGPQGVSRGFVLSVQGLGVQAKDHGGGGYSSILFSRQSP